MPLTTTGQGPVSATARWLRGFWEYYREYTHSAIHAASTAALTAFGLLIFVNRLFVVLAIATYLFPPLILYSIGSDVGKPSNPPTADTAHVDSGANTDRDSDSDDGDSDSDGDDGDRDN